MPRDDGYDDLERRMGGAQTPVLPHNAEAEQGLLGALLIDNGALDRVSGFLLPEHFYAPVHGRIFDAILKGIQQGRDVSPVSLKTAFAADEDLQHLDGAAYLTDLTTSVVTVLNVAEYGRLIFDHYLRRQLIGVAHEAIADASRVVIDLDAKQVLEAVEQKIFALADDGVGESAAQHFSGIIIDVIKDAENAYRGVPSAMGISTGIGDLDKKVSLLPGKLLVIAGASSMGKTSLATNIAFSAARTGDPVGFFSLEMTKTELGKRICCQNANLDGERVQRGELDNYEFQAFVKSTMDLARLPLHIDDTPALSIGQLRTKARRLKRQHNIKLVVVDYLQLLRGTGSKQSRDSRTNEVAEITRGLKALAKELGLPVIALSQLSRDVDRREDKRPQMSDLRESGTIEQDADVVMFVYRQHYYLIRSEPQKSEREAGEKFTERMNDWHDLKTKTNGTGEVIIAKNRGGSTGNVRVRWNEKTTAFSSLPMFHEGNLSV